MGFVRFQGRRMWFRGGEGEEDVGNIDFCFHQFGLGLPLLLWDLCKFRRGVLHQSVSH